MKILTPLTMILIATLFSSCAVKNRYDTLQAVSMDKLRKTAMHKSKHTRLGIAFGGGGVRGFMHIGVLKALEEEGIHADIVTGTSSGSVSAALYATGKDYKEIESIITALHEDDVSDIVVSTEGILNGQALAQWINKVTGNVSIESLPISLGITVSDLSTATPLLIIQGDLGKAVQASSSIPGAFIPVKSKEKTYVDGGVLSLVPIRFARLMGADVVIGIDVYCGTRPPIQDGALMTTIAAFRMQTCALARIEASEADILIRPIFEPENLRSFNAKDEAIKAGYQAAKTMLPDLKKKLLQHHYVFKKK